MVDLVKLHHVSFAIKDLDASKKFFGEVLGLPEIVRPGFNFSGAWYALGDRQLHLIAESSNSSDGRQRLTRADHMALEVRDVEAVKTTLSDNGIDYQLGGNSDLGMDQVFLPRPGWSRHRVRLLPRQLTRNASAGGGPVARLPGFQGVAAGLLGEGRRGLPVFVTRRPRRSSRYSNGRRGRSRPVRGLARSLRADRGPSERSRAGGLRPGV